MQLVTIALLAALLGLSAARRSYLLPEDPTVGATSCPGQPNTNVPWTGTPTLVKEVANGSLYTVGEADDQINSKRLLAERLSYI